VDAVDQARAVLDRLERIEALRVADAPAGILLAEVRSLLTEAEAWVEADRPGARAEEALERCRDALAAGERSTTDALLPG
jgi:predicted nicotinamide N-methyase